MTIKTFLQKIRAFVEERPFLTTVAGMGWNLTFAVFNGILAVFYLSYWHLMLFALYLILGFMKFSTVTVSKSRRRTESHMLLLNGLLMLFLAIVLCGLMLGTFGGVADHSFQTLETWLGAFSFGLCLLFGFNMLFYGWKIRSK